MVGRNLLRSIARRTHIIKGGQIRYGADLQNLPTGPRQQTMREQGCSLRREKSFIARRVSGLKQKVLPFEGEGAKPRMCVVVPRPHPGHGFLVEDCACVMQNVQLDNQIRFRQIFNISQKDAAGMDPNRIRDTAYFGHLFDAGAIGGDRFEANRLAMAFVRETKEKIPQIATDLRYSEPIERQAIVEEAKPRLIEVYLLDAVVERIILALENRLHKGRQALIVAETVANTEQQFVQRLQLFHSDTLSRGVIPEHHDQARSRVL